MLKVSGFMERRSSLCPDVKNEARTPLSAPSNSEPTPLNLFCLARDDADFHGLDVHAVFLQPGNRAIHLGPLAVQFQADDADFVSHRGLADIGGHLELVTYFPDERLLDQ